MPIDSNYLFVVNMDIDADKEALFNEVYDTEHIPNLLKVYPDSIECRKIACLGTGKRFF